MNTKYNKGALRKCMAVGAVVLQAVCVMACVVASSKECLPAGESLEMPLGTGGVILNDM